MRKYKKKEILNILELLNGANRDIRKVWKSGNTDALQKLLTECQNAAISVGNTIEADEGEGTEAVAYLEEYCELLYQVLTGDYASIAKLKESIYQAKCSVKVMPERIEMVFLPYKASMWDSFESVWRAAKEDENCDAYVIPIPYYDKNPDGSFKEEHYEGDLYPDEVPITRYDAYDFGQRRPDIVFIHNPYDECNYVTSVHPFFYSENLVQYTDKLVYIPYFVLTETNPGNPKAVKKIEHFCTVPAVIYADKVIVQSEAMRQIYINEYLRFAEENELQGEHTKKEFLEKKILGLGSPKIDKIRHMGNVPIPQEWQSKIFRADGSRKKVIFLNTNVSLILHNAGQFVPNLCRMVDTIEQYGSEYTLIWREHPLTMATLTSMQPDLLQEYQTFKARFLQKNWTILDETPEAHTAMTISDCYYGAGGSLIPIYATMNKPMLVTDYFYPRGISEQEITLEELFRSMGPRVYFNEKNRNTLNLYLENFEEISARQKERMKIENEKQDFNGNIGYKIYQTITQEEERV